MDAAELLSRVSPAVVTIFGFNQAGVQLSQGSGFIVASDGLVLTAWHVVARAAKARLRLSSGASCDAKGLTAWDIDADFAVLKVEGTGLPTVPLGDSDVVRQGESILVLGAPLGLEKTASQGIVSAVRDWPRQGKVLQVTAPISPGSSGGPLLDAQGCAVGVISFLMSKGQNLSFAIPINVIKPRLASSEPLTPLAVATATQRNAGSPYCPTAPGVTEPEPGRHTREDYWTTLGPAAFADYIGNTAAREEAEDIVAAARRGGTAMRHILMEGPPGMGKTTLARVMAHELGSRCWVYSGATSHDITDFAEALLEMQAGDVVFIDEIHALPRRVAQAWYSAMEDLYLEAPGKAFMYRGEEWVLKSGWMSPFTLIGATTSPGAMPKPFLDRFLVRLQLQAYTAEELAEILGRAAARMGRELPVDCARAIAGRSKDTPQTGVGLLERVFTASVARGLPVDIALVHDALAARGIDAHGMDGSDRRYLAALGESCVPLGLTTLCGRLGLDSRTVEWAVEPWFLRHGFVDKTSRGRCLTKAGKDLYVSVFCERDRAEGGTPSCHTTS